MFSKLAKRYGEMPVTTKAALWFTVCNCISSGISFLSMPFFTRLMSSDQYGIVTVYNSWVQVFSVFATLNLSAGAFNNGMVKFSKDRDRYSSSMEGLFSVVNLAVAAVVIGTCATVPGLIDMPLPLIVTMFFQIFANHIYALWCARQRYEYKYIALLGMTFVFAVAVTVLSVVVVALVPDDSMKAMTKASISAIGGCLVALAVVVVTQRKSPHPYVGEYWKFAFSFSVPLIPHYLSLIVLGQIDRIMIASIVGESAAAHYAVAYTIGMALSIVSSALNSSIVPWQFEKIKRGDYNGLSQRATTIVAFLSAVGVAMALISPEILLIAAPGEYQEAVIVMPPVVMSVVFTFIYNVLSNYEFYFMANKFISIASMIAAVVNIVLNLAFIPVFGFAAAAYSTVVCYGLLAAAHTIFSLHVCRKNVGVEVTSKMLNPKQIWLVAYVAMAAMLGCNLLYPFPVIRYVVIAVLCIVAFVKRDEIRKLLGR